MKKSVPIQTDLFRFATLRSPDVLAGHSGDVRFILPDIQRSAIFGHLPASLGEEHIGSAQQFLENYTPYSAQELIEVYPLLYELSYRAFKKNLSINDLLFSEDIGEQISAEIEKEKILRLFDELIYQIIMKESKYLRQIISQMLIVIHTLNNPKLLLARNINRLNEIKIEIPKEIIEYIQLSKDCEEELNGVQNLGIVDFRRVEQEVCCYVPGEVSHIENVMAKEYKERSTRNYVRTEDTIETSRETEIENLTDVTTTTRNEISSEITNVLKEDESSKYGGSLGVSAKIGGASVDVKTYADFATSNSSSYSNTEAKKYSEEVTRRALERIIQKTSEKRTSKIIKEFEENNKHGFDNRNGDAHVTGIYRWLDIIYKNRLVNYGKRLMIEFMVPEPAEFYKRVLKYIPGQSEEDLDELEKPMSLEEFGITRPEDITRDKALNAGGYYGVNIQELPQNEIQITKTLSPAAPIRHDRDTRTQNLEAINVPQNYEADTIIGSYSFDYRARSAFNSASAFCDFNFGGQLVQSRRDFHPRRTRMNVGIDVNFDPNLSGSIPVGTAYAGVFSFHGAVEIKCLLKSSFIADWQNDIYNQLLSAYNQKLEEYERLKKELEAENELDLAEREITNPAMHRIIEQRELQRACIEMLMKPYCREQGDKNYNNINACDLYEIPQVSQTEIFDRNISEIKFFEQAFDWQIMSYLFYPYYWAHKCDWADLMQSENEDLIFQAFLQSGMARVVVPVRPQFIEAILYYLETGDIWLGRDSIPGSDDDLYLSIAEEMETIEGIVEEEWETRVPTTLAIIQGKSAYLEQEGLPCCDEVENEEQTTNIVGSDAILQMIKPE